MPIASEVRAAVAEFRTHVPSMKEPTWHVHRTSDMKMPRAARKAIWARSGGIYAFYNGTGELRYIGRALLGVGLASRVPDHLKVSRYGDPEWDKVLDDVDALVEVCALDDEDGIWIPSLELFLCDRFPGLVNRRRS